MGNCINFRRWFGYNSTPDEDNTSVANPEDGNGQKSELDASDIKAIKDQLKQSEDQIDILKSKLKNYEESVINQQQDLQVELKACNDEFKGFKVGFENALKSTEKESGKQLASANEQLASAKEQLATTVKSFRELAQIMKLLDKTFHEKKELQSFVDGKNEWYKIDLEDFSVNKRDLEISLQECDKRIKDLDKVLKQKEAAVKNVNHKRESFNAEIDKLRVTLGEIGKQLLELKSSELKLKEEVNGLSNEIEQLSKSKSTFQSEISVKGKRKQDILALNGKAEATIKTNTSKKQDLSNHKCDTEKKLESTALNIQEARANAAKIEGELQQINSQKKDLKTEKDKIQRGMDEYDKKCSKSADELAKMNSKLEVLASELNILKVKKNQASELLETAKQELPKFQQENGFVQEKLVAERERIEQLNATMVEKKEELRRVHEALEKQQAEYTELQESNDIFVLSYKEQLQSEINGVLQELREEGVICLKHCFSKWGSQIRELLEQFDQFLKSDQHVFPTCDSADVMMRTELNHLQSLDSVIKNAYLLKSVIQYFLHEIDLKGLDESVLNEEEECTTKCKVVVNFTDPIELQSSQLLKNLEHINRLALELSCARFGNVELLENLQKQMKYWEEVQQRLNVLKEAVAVMETTVSEKEFAVAFSNASVNESVSTDTSIVNQDDVEAINVSHGTQRILAYADNQLTKLTKEYEALHNQESSIAEVELNRKDQKLKKLEEEKQQLQHELEDLNCKVDKATSENQSLQGSINEKQLNFDTLSKALDDLQLELQRKESEKKEASTKFMHIKEVEKKLEMHKADKLSHEGKLKSLKQKLEALQQERQQSHISEADVTTNSDKIEFGNNEIYEMQRHIDKADEKIESYEEQLTQLNKSVSVDIESTIAQFNAQILSLKSETSDINSSIATLQHVLSNNVTTLASYKIQKKSQADRIKSIEATITGVYSEALDVYAHDVVAATLGKAIQALEISGKIGDLQCLKSDITCNHKVDALVEKWSVYEKNCKSYECSLQEEFRKQQSVKQDVAKELEYLKHVENQYKLKLKQWNEKFDQEMKNMAQHQKAVEDAEKISEEKEQAKVELLQGIKGKEEVLTQFKTEREKLKQSVSSCDSRISSLSEVKKAKGESLKSCKSNKEKLEQAQQRLNTKLLNIEKQFEEAERLIDQASSSQEKYIKELNMLEENLAKLGEKVEETNNHLKQKIQQKIEEEKKLHEVKGSIEASIKKESRHNAQLENTKKKYEAVKCEQEKLQEHHDQLWSKRTNVGDTKRRMEALNDDLEELQGMLSNLAVGSHDTVKNKLQSVYEIEKLLQEVEKAKSREQELKDKNEQHIVSLNSMQKREQELKDKNEQLNVSLTKKTKDLTDENAKLREELRHNKPHPALAPRPITGLTNLGNTCYFNSMLQGLNQATVLFQLLSSLFDTSTKVQEHVISSPTPGSKELVVKIPNKPRPFAEAMYQFYQDVDSKGNDHYCLRPLRLRSLIGQKNHRFLGHSQQDSHEAFRCLLDGLRMEEIDAVKFEIYKRFGTTEEEQRRFPKKLCPEDKTLLRGYLRKATKITTMLDKVFGGVLVNTIVCHHCHDTPQTYEPFLDLSLPITKDNSLFSSLKAAFVSSKKSLLKDDAALQKHLEDHQCKHKPLSKGIDSSLHEFTALDELDDDNKFICQKCTAQLQKKSGKDDDYALCNVSKSLVIDQLPKVLILHFKRFYLEPVVRKDDEHVSFSKVLDMAPYCTTECIEKPGMNGLYTLFAVVVHSGTLHGGHYTAFVNKSDGSENKEWYYISDSHVSKCHNGFKDVERCQAYMLFYEQN